MHHGFLMWGNRVIVPTNLRGRVLYALHDGHMGTVKMKGLAKGYVWWPQMDEDIEGVTKRYERCQGVANNPKQAPRHRHITLNCDYFGYFRFQVLLLSSTCIQHVIAKI